MAFMWSFQLVLFWLQCGKRNKEMLPTKSDWAMVASKLVRELMLCCVCVLSFVGWLEMRRAGGGRAVRKELQYAEEGSWEDVCSTCNMWSVKYKWRLTDVRCAKWEARVKVSTGNLPILCGIAAFFREKTSLCLVMLEKKYFVFK